MRSKLALGVAPYEGDFYIAQRATALGSPAFDAQGLATADAYIAVMAGRYYAVIAVEAGQSAVRVSELRYWGGGTVDLTVGTLTPDTVLTAGDGKADAADDAKVVP